MTERGGARGRVRRHFILIIIILIAGQAAGGLEETFLQIFFFFFLFNELEFDVFEVGFTNRDDAFERTRENAS